MTIYNFPARDRSLLLAALFFLALSFTNTLAEDNQHPGSPNILLITIDSLRPDHLTCYGYTKPTSPWIDRIAREGTLFRNAFAQGGWTSPAMVSILTGLYPSAHGVEARGDRFPCPEQAPLTQWVKAGYQVPARNSLVEEDNYSHLGFQGDADYGRTLETLFAWIRKHKSKPFFCWHHINKTPHLPYDPKIQYRNLFWPKDASRPPSLNGEPFKTIRSKVIIPKGTLALAPEDKPYIDALYDGEVRMADDALNSIYRFLDEEKLLDSTILVLTADHGDELLDHGFIGHASTNWEGTLYDEVIHVPLIIRYPPSIPAGKVLDEVVETLDILPTLQDFTPISSDVPMQGRSLNPLIAGDAKGWPGTAFSENSLCGYQCRQVPKKSRVRLASVRTKEWKLVATHSPGQTRFELFHLSADPNEKRNCYTDKPNISGELKDALLNKSYESRILRREICNHCFSEKP